MNWKNVLSLMQVERKSGRLIRGKKLTKYHENRFLAYWPYWVALAVGIAGGVLAGVIYNFATTANTELLTMFQEGTLSFFFSLPTLVLVYSLVFTMMKQIRLSGVKTSSQVPYWLPVTWQEHTLASILASLMGFPLASVVFITSIITVFSVFIGQIPIALLTSLAVFAAAFMASVCRVTAFLSAVLHRILLRNFRRRCNSHPNHCVSSDVSLVYTLRVARHNTLLHFNRSLAAELHIHGFVHLVCRGLVFLRYHAEYAVRIV